MARDQHVVPRGDKWAVTGEGSRRATKVTNSKAQAMSVARYIARRQGTDVIVHGRAGKILGKDSYGARPAPIGRKAVRVSSAWCGEKRGNPNNRLCSLGPQCAG